MKRFLAWVVSGVGFALGVSIVLFVYSRYIGTPGADRELAKSELAGILEIAELEQTKSEDRLAFNVLVKNSSEDYFPYAWLRVELFDSNGDFLNSCDDTAGAFEAHTERWVQIKCSLPGFNYDPEYESVKFGIMTATVEPQLGQ